MSTTINRAPYNGLVDDDGSNTVGSIWNKNAVKNVLLDPIDQALQCGQLRGRVWADVDGGRGRRVAFLVPAQQQDDDCVGLAEHDDDQRERQ